MLNLTTVKIVFKIIVISYSIRNYANALDNVIIFINAFNLYYVILKQLIFMISQNI